MKLDCNLSTCRSSVCNVTVWAPHLLLASLALIIVGGCAETGESTHRVRGRVTYQGEPLTDAVISFFPTSGKPSGEPLGDDGTYALKLPAGQYQVILNAAIQLPDGWKEGDPIPNTKPRIPTFYAQPKRSGLTATVEPGGDNIFDFALK